MTNSHGKKRTYTFGTARTGNTGKVQEECWEAGDLLYRKVYEMPANMVPAFVEARRRVIAMQMLESGNNYVEPESGGVN